LALKESSIWSFVGDIAGTGGGKDALYCLVENAPTRPAERRLIRRELEDFVVDRYLTASALE
jgi:hypothetical protein